MSRSGYNEDCDDNWRAIIYRGAVTSAIRGKRGQAFLKEMLHALDSLPEHKLIAGELEQDGAVCAIGAVGKARGVDMAEIDPDHIERVASVFGISVALAREAVYTNDSEDGWIIETPAARFQRMRKWVADQIRPEPAKTEGRT